MEDDNKSYFTFDLELEKQVDLLTDCDDDNNDLNDAKLNLNNDISMLSSNNKSLYSNPNNLTTPLKHNINNNIINTDVEEKFSSIYTNTNTARKFSRESLSSLFEKFPDNNNNYNINFLNGKENNNINRNKTMIDFQSNSLDLNNRNNFNQYRNNVNFYDRFNKYQKPFIPYYSFYNNRNNITTMTDYYNHYINISNSSMPVMRMMTNKFTQSSNISIDSKSGNDKIIAMIKDQSGSKFIQKKIEEKSSEFLYKLYEQIKSNLIDIINDQYGNYVIQKYVEFCDKKIISLMLNQLQNSLFEVSLNSYGTRALQKMIENLSPLFDDDINIILNFVKGNVFKMIRDINGNHVIQSIIEAIKNKDKLTPLYSEMNEHLIEISKIKQGCCVFPKVLNNIREDDLANFINNIIKNLDTLINDEYGNFIIQRIIKLNRENYNNQIFDLIKNKIVQLSTQKYSSNVIETCIFENINIREKVMEKLIEKNNVTNLICDQFGNYIIQKCLPLVKGKQFKSMIEQIKKAVKTLNQSNHGRKIYENLLKNYRDYFQDSKNFVFNNKGKQKKNNAK